MTDKTVWRAVFTNELIRAIGALARQQNVCREQEGQVVFVTGMEAAREYIVEQLASAALVSHPSSGWQPIETAPKDGTKVLAWDGFDCGVFVWCGDDAGWNAHELCMEGPTHWMPLPTPPEPTS